MLIDLFFEWQTYRKNARRNIKYINEIFAATWHAILERYLPSWRTGTYIFFCKKSSEQLYEQPKWSVLPVSQQIVGVLALSEGWFWANTYIINIENTASYLASCCCILLLLLCATSNIHVRIVLLLVYGISVFNWCLFVSVLILIPEGNPIGNK